MSLENNIACSECQNSNCFIKKCGDEWVSLLNTKKHIGIYDKEQDIFREGALVSGVYFIQQGKVKVICTGLGGKEQIVRLAADGHILGHRGYGGETYPVGAVSLDRSRICFIENEILYEAFKANFDFIYEVMMFYSGELRKSELRTKYFAQMTVDEKVTFGLYYIVETFGFNEIDKTIKIILSRGEIAAISGTNSDQVSRTIAFLKTNKIISTQGKKIQLMDYDALKNIIESYASSSL